MATEEEAINTLKHHGDALFRDHPNLAFAAVRPVGDNGVRDDDFNIYWGLIDEVLTPGRPLTPEEEARFGAFTPDAPPASLPIPDEHGHVAENAKTVPVVSEVTGPITAQSFTRRQRPALGGDSIGNARFSFVGTLGGAFDRHGKSYLVSNHHVLYGPNGQDGDPVLQPGVSDGGQFPQDVIAVNVYGEMNHLRDVAFAELTNPHIVAKGVRNLGAINGLGHAQYFMPVKKSGRTTESSWGRVASTYAWVRVGYSWGTRLFVDQIVISYMSAGGDSGSLVLADATNEVVGLLFAGGTSFTFANKAEHVFAALSAEGKAAFIGIQDC